MSNTAPHFKTKCEKLNLWRIKYKTSKHKYTKFSQKCLQSQKTYRTYNDSNLQKDESGTKTSGN